MTTVTGVTAAKMQEILDDTIVDAEVVGDNLILTKHDASTVDAGNVRGEAGPPGLATRVTELPVAPEDGDQIFLVLGANGELGHFVYNEDSVSDFKWECVGGSDLYDEVTADMGTVVSTVYVASGGGPFLPSLVVPEDGDYDLDFGGNGLAIDTADAFLYIAPKFGSAGAVDSDAIIHRGPSAGNHYNPAHHSLRKEGLNAGDTIQLVAKVSANTGVLNGFAGSRLMMRLRAIRIG